MNQIVADPLKSLDFLECMFGLEETLHLFAISEGEPPEAKSFVPEQRRVLPLWVQQREGRSNIYFAVNRLVDGFIDRKAKKENVVAAGMLHVDVDDPDALERVSAFTPKPTAVVFSGGGYQAFWLLKEPTKELDRVEAINMAIARALGGDNCHNIDRIMRLPGTINVPNLKKRAKGRVETLAYLVSEETDWSRRYALSDFAGLFTVVALAERDLVSVELAELPENVSEKTRALIQHGDDQDRPIGSSKPRFKSRSEAVWRVALDLARANCSPALIAGVLINPSYGISASVLEKSRNANAYAKRQAQRAIEAASDGWPDVTKAGQPRPTLRNAILAMTRLGIAFAFDQFRYRKTVEGVAIQEYQGDLSDDACTKLRHVILEKFGFDPGKENIRDAAHTLSLESPHHPVRDYLDALRWDGVPRLEKWLTTYLGAEDTELNAAIGRIVLTAAVRRVRSPGVKFDTILVLEGPQGGGKSTAIKILAGEENFSDQDILTLDHKAQMESLEGVWLYEIAELEGLSRADTTKVKAFISRTADQGRPAYGRFKEVRPRQTVFIGTTNDETYLRDMTGNRRFWPVKTGAIDLAKLTQDRDQLWAEAAHYEERGEPITLPENLWPVAAAEQEARLEEDPWQEKLADIPSSYLYGSGEFVRVSTSALLTDVLHIPIEKQHQQHTKRLAAIMRKLGWEGPMQLKMRDGNARGYQRELKDGEELPPPPF